MNIFLQIGTPEYEALINAVRVETRITTERELRNSQDVWLTIEESMEFMKVKSSNTLIKYRNESGSPIQVSGTGKNTRYLKSSLNDYLKWKKW